MAGSSVETWHSCTYSQWEPSASPLPTPTPRARSTWTRRGRWSCARTTAPRAPGGRLQRLLSEGYRHPLRQRYSCRVANRVGILRAPAPPPCPYSPKCVEEEFCELRLYGVLRPAPAPYQSGRARATFRPLPRP